MPSNSQKKSYIITGINFRTCWPVAQAVARHNGNFIRRFIGQEIIKKFGTPKRILTDCGREFISQDTQAYLCSKEIEHITTTPYHPQANGRVERLNGIVLTALRKLAQENASSWVKHLPTALLMARSRVNRDIYFSSFKMVYGYKPDIQDLPKGLRLVEPDDVPKGNDISFELKIICNLASEQRAKRVCKQVIKRTDLFEITMKSGFSTQLKGN